MCFGILAFHDRCMKISVFVILFSETSMLQENLKILIQYVVDTFWDRLARFENLSSIHALKVKYEQVNQATFVDVFKSILHFSPFSIYIMHLQTLETAGARSSSSLLDQRKRTDERALEKEEEDYFNEDRFVSHSCCNKT